MNSSSAGSSLVGFVVLSTVASQALYFLSQSPSTVPLHSYQDDMATTKSPKGAKRIKKPSAKAAEAAAAKKDRQVKWKSSVRVTWTHELTASLLSIILDSSRLKSGLFPGPGDGTVGQPKSQLYWELAQAWVRNDFDNDVAKSELRIASKGQDPIHREMRDVWGRVVKNRLGRSVYTFISLMLSYANEPEVV